MSDTAEHYKYRVHWSPEDDLDVGTVAELPSLSWLAEDEADALARVQRVALRRVADQNIVSCQADRQGPKDDSRKHPRC